MPSMIDLLSDNPAVRILLKAVAEHANSEEIMRACTFNGANAKSAAIVQVIVNGVEVDFIEHLQKGVGDMMEQYEDEVAKAAREMLLSSRLSGLVYALDMAEWRIKQEIEKLKVPR